MAAAGMGPVDQLSTRERYDGCLRLADHWYNRFQSRRQFEWKVAFGLWTLLLAGIRFLREQNNLLPKSFFIAVGLAYSFLWLRGLWVANESDKQMANHFATQAQQILREPDYRLPPQIAVPQLTHREWLLGFATSWGTLGQFMTTIGLLAAAYYSMQYSPASAANLITR